MSDSTICSIGAKHGSALPISASIRSPAIARPVAPGPSSSGRSSASSKIFDGVTLPCDPRDFQHGDTFHRVPALKELFRVRGKEANLLVHRKKTSFQSMGQRAKSATNTAPLANLLMIQTDSSDSSRNGGCRKQQDGPYNPRDHFCSRTQRNATTTHPMPASGIWETNVHTAALIRHSTMAKMPTRMLVIDRDSVIHNGRDYVGNWGDSRVSILRPDRASPCAPIA